MRDRIGGLDLMRTAAIAMVIGGHGMRLAVGHLSPVVSFWADNLGGFGVSLFFALSGFLIGGILVEGLQAEPALPGLRRFLVRRWFRTLPNYYLFLAVNAGLGTWGPGPRPEASYAFFLQNLSHPAGNFFGESWSLAVEEWFYVLLPLLALAGVPLAKTPRVAARWAACVLITLGLATKAGLLFADTTLPYAVSTVVPVQFDCLGYGVLLACVPLERFSKNVVIASGAGALGLTALLVWLGSRLALPLEGTGFSPGAETAISMVGITMSSWIAACMLPVFHAVHAPARAWRAGSRLAYSLYLVNLPLAWLFVGAGAFAHWPSAMRCVAWVALCVAAAAATYQFVERPFLRLRDRVAPSLTGAGAGPRMTAETVRRNL